MFSRLESNKLSLYRLYNYNILLILGTEPPAQSLKKYSQDKLRVIKKYLEDYLLKS